ncbi:hypothetical protein DPMN_030609 [Dreissena polymorpha]|uniref:Uncharacterized protein n=1 Tax=Dreissena polymorpha TaxID=45954 RepID=A0A9D4M0K8_DREPO|nr:hypothetical protein DPMN_030551 [Dreissena polymorpha]KAH3867481.1 hypothetical protein DPMN_030609 [Dreissena polymorpha]
MPSTSHIKPRFRRQRACVAPEGSPERHHLHCRTASTTRLRLLIRTWAPSPLKK